MFKSISLPLIAIILATIGVVGYLVYQQNDRLKQLPSQAEQTAKFSESTTDEWKTYVDEESQFSFKYPQNLKPLELSNGVVTFLPKDSHQQCKEVLAQDFETVDDLSIYDPCNVARFNLSGYQVNPSENYQQHLDDLGSAARPSSFTDEKNRTWHTTLVQGQVYNFTAFTQINNTPIKVSFQYGFRPPQEDEVIAFFNQVLTTFEASNLGVE